MKIPLLNIEINKASFIKSLKKAVNFRPEQGLDERGVGSPEEGLIPITPIAYEDCYAIVDWSDTLTTVHDALKQEIFRNGSEWEPNFIKKCLNKDCNAEYQKEVEKCEICGSLVRDPQQLPEKIRKLFETKHVNKNKQTLHDIEEQFEDDRNTVDICYVLAIKEYSFVNGKLQEAKVQEFMRGDPCTFRIIADKTGRLGYDDQGRKILFCLEHRDTPQYDPAKKCPLCNKQLFQAHYVVKQQETGRKYYSPEEVIHVTKYRKSLTYGWPKVIQAYNKVRTLIYQDTMILDWYKGRKPPRGILLVASRSFNALKKAWDWLLKKVKKNPGSIYPLGIEHPGSQGGKLAEYIQFTNSLEEMQYTQTREELRRTIGALYGVMPIFEGDMSTSGGLNNEGLQVTVTSRAALYGQRDYKNKIRPWILKQLKVTEWNYVPNSPEEKDEMAEKQRFQIEAQTAQQMLQMGFDVTLNEEGEFEYSGDAKPPTLPGMGGFGFPGAPPNPPDMTDHDEGAPDKFGIKKSVEIQKKKVWVKDPRVKGGGYWRNIEGGKKTDWQTVQGRMSLYQDRGMTRQMAVENIARELLQVLLHADVPEKKKEWTAFINGLSEKERHALYKKFPTAQDYAIGQAVSKSEKGPGGHIRDKTGPHGIGAGPGKGTKECEDDLKKIFRSEIEDIEKSEDVNIITKADDFYDFLKQAIYNLTFKSISKAGSDKIKSYLLIKAAEKAIAGSTIIRAIMDLGDVSKDDAERIYRTEFVSVLRNQAREYGYEKRDPEGVFKYHWQGPKDHRTTDICKKISLSSSQGVSMIKLKQIIAKNADPTIYEENRPFTPHINCRHRLIKTVRR